MQEKPKKRNRFIRALIEFGENTSFHGVKYVVSSENTIYEKIFWVVVVLSGFSGAVYMTMIFWERFSSNPIRITIQPVHKQTSVIPFPAVTICTAIRQLPEKVDKFIKTLKLPDNVTAEEVKDMFPNLMGYAQPVDIDPDEVMILDKIFKMNDNLSTSKIFSQIEPDCNNLLIKCRWEQQIVPCNEIFRTTLTTDGHCCSFNAILGSKKKTKFRTLFYGVQMGLSIILNPVTNNITKAVSTLSSTGIKVLIHSSEDYAGISSIEKILGNGTETFIRILGTKLTSSESIKSLSPEQRNCLFDDEMELNYFNSYRDTNCGVECKMDAIYYYCKCIPFTFPKTDKRVCGISDIICLTNNYNTIYRKMSNKTNTSSQSPDCDCPSQCNDVFYTVQTSSIPINFNVPTISNFYEIDERHKISDRMVIHIYYGNYHQTEMLRDTITSTYYLLSSFGGVFSLFLGCSFLSILENNTTAISDIFGHNVNYFIYSMSLVSLQYQLLLTVLGWTIYFTL